MVFFQLNVTGLLFQSFRTATPIKYNDILTVKYIAVAVITLFIGIAPILSFTLYNISPSTK